jgi:demethylmenaquinone methyltransferase/2-methoxy-6-polyprenyl-1,4-benzoquinol methylase
VARVRAVAEEALPQGEDKARAVRAMFDGIAPRYDLVNRLMTFRLDVGWRRRAVAALGLARGARVLDLGAGTGDLCRELTRAGYRPVGMDLSWGMLTHARTGAPLVQADALRLPVARASADGAVSGFTLRNLVDLGAFFSEVARVVRPDGRVALLEVGQPRSRLLQAGHRVWFGRAVPLIGGLLSDPAAYRYLPRSVAYLPDAGQLLAMVRGAGFRDVHDRALSGGVARLITATRAAGA